MNCPKCNSNEINIKKSEEISEVKYRIVNYEKETSICSACGFDFLSPKQLDSNNSSLKKAYKQMVN